MNKLNAGSGGEYLDGWVNMDIHSTYRVDMQANILQTHFDENSFDVIFCSHMIEHLRFPIDTVECLERFYRWLRPEGICRIVVPDLELAVNAYVKTGDLSFLYGKEFQGYYHKDTKAERLNFFVRAWEHLFTFDFETLAGMLSDVGFKNILKKEPNETLIPGFHHDRFISESLYVECIK